MNAQTLKVRENLEDLQTELTRLQNLSDKALEDEQVFISSATKKPEEGAPGTHILILAQCKTELISKLLEQIYNINPAGFAKISFDLALKSLVTYQADEEESRKELENLLKQLKGSPSTH